MDHLLTTHTYNEIYEIELRLSYRSPLCISVMKSEPIYQVRWHLWNSRLISSQMLFFKDSRYVHCLYLQKAYHVYQVTTLNEFINESVYTVICI